MPIVVHHEGPEFRRDVPENCKFCGVPTRYWTKDCHTPVCPNCALRKDEFELVNGSNPQLRLDIGEINELIDYHAKIADGFPKDSYKKVTASKVTIEQVVMKHRKRARELIKIRDETWPK